MDSVGGKENSAADEYDFLMSTTDAELLKKAWRNEKAAPEVLNFDAELVLRSRKQIELMEEMVEEFKGEGVDPLIISLYQMDMDRTLFLLRSYLRTRLLKIEKYAFHVEKTKELMNQRLSGDELVFALRCAADLKHHLNTNVLSKLPDQYQSHLKQSVASDEDDMVPEPKLDGYVICRSKRFLGSFQLDDDGMEEPINIEPNDLYALPYRSIKPLVESGQIDLV
ncbi:hypothetical protein M569_07932 [Genlisea aurea]|uniref:DNA replication complex GINS protein SLD5 n=1 Tax=Genlisea aurea TaxID=192259 RepID=S8CIN3_9LAMI|nr:hypothetical protein M569_07932 [Genlisea aurea]